MSTAKPTVEDAKGDLKKLEETMNRGTIPDRKPGEEVVAKTESGATVTITNGKKSVTVPSDKLGTAKSVKNIVKNVVKKLVKGRKVQKKPEQTEAAGLIPPLDGVGKAANQMVEAIKAVAAAAEEKGESESNLIRALRKAKRTSFKTQGVELYLNHRGPVDKIQVKKAK